MRFSGRSVRHELKYYINEGDYFYLCNILQMTAEPDPHMKEDGYLVSSVYFDDIYRSAREEKNAGIQFRKKYRMRCYNQEDRLIRLECKRKYGDYTAKESEEIKRSEYDAILAGDDDFLLDKNELGKELYTDRRTRLLKPVIAVEYLREAYVFRTGNVRITFDKNVSFSTGEYDIFSDHYSVRRALEKGMVIMEVKFDDFLPGVVTQMLRSVPADKCAISKYVMCSNEKGGLINDHVCRCL